MKKQDNIIPPMLNNSITVTDHRIVKIKKPKKLENLIIRIINKMKEDVHKKMKEFKEIKQVMN
jgi:hypothetical protein